MLVTMLGNTNPFEFGYSVLVTINTHYQIRVMEVTNCFEQIKGLYRRFVLFRM